MLCCHEQFVTTVQGVQERLQKEITAGTGWTISCVPENASRHKANDHR